MWLDGPGATRISGSGFGPSSYFIKVGGHNYISHYFYKNFPHTKVKDNYLENMVFQERRNKHTIILK